MCELLVVCSSEKGGRVQAVPRTWPRAAEKDLAPVGRVVDVTMAELAQEGSAPALGFPSDCTVNGHFCYLPLKHVGRLKGQVRQDGWDGWFNWLSTPAGAESEYSCPWSFRLAPQWLFHWKIVVLGNKRPHLPDRQGSRDEPVTPETLRLCEGAPSTFAVLTQPKQQHENFSGFSCSPLI